MTLEQVKQADIRTTLIDASGVNVDIGLPKTERMIDVAKQMGNCLYYFKAGKTVVKIGHSKTATATVDERIEGWIRTM